MPSTYSKIEFPPLFQRLLKLLPRPTAVALLLFIINKHAWTFVGSGVFRYQLGKVTRLTVASNIHPVAAVYGFYGGTFAHLIHTLVDAKAEMQFCAPASTDQPVTAQPASQQNRLADCTYHIYDIGRIQQRGLHTGVDLGFDEAKVMTRERLANLKTTRPEMMADVDYTGHRPRRTQSPAVTLACGAPAHLHEDAEEMVEEMVEEMAEAEV